MDQVLQQNILGKPVGEPIILDRRRRRLSTVVKRYANHRRPFFVNVRKLDEPALLFEENDKLRAQWPHTLVGPEDVVAIVYLPLGGSTRTDAAGGQSRGKQIGQAVAMIALVVAATVLTGPLAGVIGPAAATVASAAIPAGPGYVLGRGR